MVWQLLVAPPLKRLFVQVNGAEVTGNIYGGGVAGSYQNEAFDADYKQASSNVKETTISLVKGSPTATSHAGGLNIEKIHFFEVDCRHRGREIGSDFKFLKADAVIDGSGAENATLNFVNGYDFSKVAAAAEVALLDADQTAQKKIIIRKLRQARLRRSRYRRELRYGGSPMS